MSTSNNCDRDPTYLLKLSNELAKEVRSAPPGKQLSATLQKSLRKLNVYERRKVTSITEQVNDRAPLFTACVIENLDIVEYLISTCGADVELKGTFECYDDKILPQWEKHVVTPLWCTSVMGKLDIVKYLVESGGANVNSRCDVSGATPLLGACYLGHSEVIEFLVQVGGADLSIPNFRGTTCLMNSLQSYTLCKFMLDHGASINMQNCEGYTALHYAVRRHKFKISKLLVENGADPTLRNLDGEDVFQTVCLEADVEAFNYLISKFSNLIERERRAELNELMGACLIMDNLKVDPFALELWKQSVSMRYDPEKKLPDLPKQSRESTPIYAKYIDARGIETGLEISEFNTIEDLQQCSLSYTKAWTTSYFILERILPVHHEKLFFAMLFRYKTCLERGQYVRGIRALLYSFNMEMKTKSCVHNNTARAADVINKLFGDLYHGHIALDRDSPQNPLKVMNMLDTMKIFVDGFSESIPLVQMRPFHEDQGQRFNGCLQNCLLLLHMLVQMPNKTEDELIEMRLITQKLVMLNPRLSTSNDTLLHMCCNEKYITYYPLKKCQPSEFGLLLKVLGYLLECGADVNDINSVSETPLHHAVSNKAINLDVVKILLENGAHLDIPDYLNQTALMLIQSNNLLLSLNINPLEHISLQCLAASAIRKEEVDDVPQYLRSFVESHQSK